MRLYVLQLWPLYLALWAAAQMTPTSTVSDPHWNPTNSSQWGVFAGCAVSWNEISAGDFNIGNAQGGSAPEILCGFCTDISPDINNCCSAFPAGDCLPGGTTWRAVVSTETASMKTDSASNWVACSAISQVFQYCSINTAGFYNLPANSQSSCLCNSPVQEIDDSVTTVGFGVAASQCYQYLENNEPSYAPGFSTTLLSLCPATGTPKPASTATQGAVSTSTSKSSGSRLFPEIMAGMGVGCGFGSIAFVGLISGTIKMAMDY